VNVDGLSNRGRRDGPPSRSTTAVRVAAALLVLLMFRRTRCGPGVRVSRVWVLMGAITGYITGAGYIVGFGWSLALSTH